MNINNLLSLKNLHNLNYKNVYVVDHKMVSEEHDGVVLALDGEAHHACVEVARDRYVPDQNDRVDEMVHKRGEWLGDWPARSRRCQPKVPRGGATAIR